MKKVLRLALIGVLALTFLVGFSSNEANEGNLEGTASEDNIETIKIGVTPEPHRTLVELVVDDLREEGVEVEVVEFTDYITPNTTLADGDLDANFFQHGPYFDDFIEKQDLDLVSIGNIHVEPMALYSNSAGSLDELADGSDIAIPNDSVNGGRALLLLDANGLIGLDDSAGIEATINDIVDNPKNFKITELEAAFLPRALDDVDAAVINGNYALEADLNPLTDGLIIEGGESPYANLIAVRKGEENEEKYDKLLKALQSDKVKTYIEETYEGAVVPAF